MNFTQLYSCNIVPFVTKIDKKRQDFTEIIDNLSLGIYNHNVFLTVI